MTHSIRQPNVQFLKSNPYKRILLLILCSFAFLACGGEDGNTQEDDFTPPDPGVPVPPPRPDMGMDTMDNMDVGGMDVGGMDGGEPMGAVMMPTGGMPMGPIYEEVCTQGEPDLELLKVDVGPTLYQRCGNQACHGVSSTVRSFILPADYDPRTITSPLEDTLADDTLTSMLDFITYGDPNGSELLQKAYNAHFSGQVFYALDSKEYSDLSTFIQAEKCEQILVTPPEMGGTPPEMGGMPPEMGGTPPEMGGTPPEMGGTPTPAANTSIYCDQLPNGDPLGREGFYETFEADVNLILQAQCTGSGCHGNANNGFWIQPDEEPCSVEANFITSMLYVTPWNIDYSPILSKPLDPNHGGYRTFAGGQSDPFYIIIRNWLIDGYVNQEE